jgi:uncharacterized protein YrrD
VTNTINTTMTDQHIIAFLEFMSPSFGQVIRLTNDKVLLSFSEDGDYRIAWFSNGAAIHPMNVQTCIVARDPDILPMVRDIFAKPSTAKVLGAVTSTGMEVYDIH